MAFQEFRNAEFTGAGESGDDESSSGGDARKAPFSSDAAVPGRIRPARTGSVVRWRGLLFLERVRAVRGADSGRSVVARHRGAQIAACAAAVAAADDVEDRREIRV